MEDTLANIGEWLSTAGQVLAEFFSAVGMWIVLFFSWAAEGISEFVDGLNLPMMPSLSKIFQNSRVSGTILALVAIYIVVINVMSYHMFVSDKKKAQSRKERISEHSLMRVCFWGGALGGFIGMRSVRHKTQKKKFTIGVTVMLVIQVLLFSFVAGFFGFWIYLA